MTRHALLTPSPGEPTGPTNDDRRTYEDVLVRAMAHAERLLPRAEAFEVAHDVALELMSRPAPSVSGVLIYIAVRSRLRNARRGTDRRAALEGAYLDSRMGATPAWAQPGADLEARELRDHLAAAIADMPAGMRDAFLLVRDQGLSYKDAAARLGIGVGTVHTQVSRANAILRECLRQYRSRAAEPLSSSRRPHRP